MSENITLAKSRKKFTLSVNEGDFFVLVQPDKQFNEHLLAYREIAAKAPINDEFERVVTGRVNYTSSALNLVTTKQDSEKRAVQSTHLNRVEDAVSEAQKRQAKRESDEKLALEKAHADTLAKKNSLVNEVRKDTKQPEIKTVNKKPAEPVAA